MRLAKLAYYCLPPAVSHAYAKAKNIVTRRKQAQASQLRLDLNELRKKGLGYFFANDLVAKFCDYLERDDAVNQTVATRKPVNQPYLDSLVEKGYCVMSGLFPSAEIRGWHDQVKPTLEAASRRCDELVQQHGVATMQNLQENFRGSRTNFELVSGIVRLWEAHVTFPALCAYHRNEDVLDVVGSYFGGNLNESSVYAEYKSKVHQYDPNIHYHADSPFRILKVWLLLNDVGPENGPLVYCEGSQRIRDWRLLRDLLVFSHYNRKYMASYCDFNRIELAHLARAFPEFCAPEKQVTGKAGDIIIADTRGIHGGTILSAGYRLQLGMVFTGLGNVWIGNIPDDIKALSRDSR